ncbi:MAG: nitronate monooxygenase [bacterium]
MNAKTNDSLVSVSADSVKLPPIIQGGMGVGVSGWRLANAAARAGAIGTVSLTAVANLLAYVLQKGDPTGDYRRSLKRFPYPKIVEMVMNAYFVDGGIKEGKKQKPVPMYTFEPSNLLMGLTICASFVFVDLSKEGHSKPIFINLLHEVPMPNLYSVLGAMLANVDGVVMGAGIPKEMPKLIDDIMNGERITYPIYVVGQDKVPGSDKNTVDLVFDCVSFFGERLYIKNRPLFLPIVASNTLLERLHKTYPGKIYGFIIEAPTAGGHNAPPRGKDLILNARGEPVYGERDVVDFARVASLGVPFYIAGGLASPQGLRYAQSVGANGIQVGSAFAFCEESGTREDLKSQSRKLGFNGSLDTFTDGDASPTGFPFKVSRVSETLSEEVVYNERKRVCNIGLLRTAYIKDDGSIGFRCSAEPIDNFVSKGGCIECTKRTVCLCNALMSTAGARDGEKPILTAGDSLGFFKVFMAHEDATYYAEDVVRYIEGV